MKRGKMITIGFVSIMAIALLSVLGVLLNPKNYESPSKFFLSQEKPAKIYLEYKEGGNLNYYSKVTNNLRVITDESNIELFYEMLQGLDSDFWALHRGDRSYSVYINIEDYKKKKWDIKMSRIDGDYVFFFRRGKYRNSELARYINELLEIDHR